jgi:hypothetical protein
LALSLGCRGGGGEGRWSSCSQSSYVMRACVWAAVAGRPLRGSSCPLSRPSLNFLTHFLSRYRIVPGDRAAEAILTSKPRLSPGLRMSGAVPLFSFLLLWHGLRLYYHHPLLLLLLQFGITFVRGCYNYIPKTNDVSRVCSVAAIL